MRSTCSVYVDAGYLLASAATRVTGTSLRNAIHVEFGALIAALIGEAEKRSGMPVLRLYWYDSARNGVPDPQQERIGELAKVKLRLGRFGVDGQQKGVDLRIGLDLVAHARNETADVFYLVSGDDDLTEAVEEAQVHGVQVVVLAVPTTEDKPHGVSRHLIRAADELAVISGDVIDSAVMRVDVARQPAASTVVAEVPVPPKRTNGSPDRPSPRNVAALARPPSTSPTSVLVYQGSTGAPGEILPGYDDPEVYDEQIDAVVTKVLSAFRKSAPHEELAALARNKPSVPRDIDRALLVDMSEALDVYDLNESIRYRLRQRFWDQWERKGDPARPAAPAPGLESQDRSRPPQP